MKSANLAPAHKVTHTKLTARLNKARSIRVPSLLVLVGLLGMTFFTASSESFRKHLGSQQLGARNQESLSRSGNQIINPRTSLFSNNLAPTPVAAPALLESITTYAADCVTPQASFTLGQAVCAKASGVPTSVFPYRIAWLNPAGTIVHSEVASTNDATEYNFTIPSDSSAVGTWSVRLLRSNGAVRQSASFTVSDTAQPTADVYIQKIARDASETASIGGGLAFLIIVVNGGPDAAQNVHLVDTPPIGSSPIAFTQETGPQCLPADSGNCTMASLNYGERAEFTAIYQIGGSPGVAVTSARVTSTTADSNSGNNNAFVEFEVAAGGGGSPCTLVCPTPLNFEEDPGTGGHIILGADFPVPVTTGTCGDVSTTASPNPQTGNYFLPLGTSVITASTESGESCNFSITVTDDSDPSITCPADISTFESSGGSGSAIVNFAPVATDNSGSAVVNCDHPSGSSFDVGTTPVNCTASDSSGNTSDACSFTVTVNPVNSTCTLTPPAPIVVDSAANACGANVTFTIGESASGCGTVTCDHPSGSSFPVGETLVTCTSTPDGANTSFTVTVNDVTAPVPTLATLPTLSETCSVTAGIPTTINTPTGPKVVIEVPTATDNCGGVIGGSFSAIDENGDPHGRTFDEPGSHVVTWTFIDNSGNTSTQTQTVTVSGNDTAAPIADVANLPTVTVECDVTVNPPTATDNCAGTVTGTTADHYTAAGTYTIHWTYTDGSNNSSTQNQTVVVTDVHAPTIALEGDSSITVECHTSYVDQGVTTTDNCAPENVNVVTTGLPNIDVPATYTINYTATDSGGNQASVQRTVIVQDTTKPVITRTGPASVTVECHTSYDDAGATASDTCDTSVPVTTSGSVDINVPGTYTLTYNATDDSGNPADAVQRTVTVVDTTLPTISCPSNITVYLPVNSTATSMVVNYTAPTGSDTCGGETTAQTAGLPSGAVFPVGTTTNTFTVTDGANLSTSCSFTVTVLYNFTGFFSPVSNPPVVNNVNAGRTIPLKFSLSGNKGLGIFADGYPVSQQVACNNSAPLSELEGTETSGGSTLTYSPDQYHYNWKTEGSWAGTCRQLIVKLNDGSEHTALFKFK